MHTSPVLIIYYRYFYITSYLLALHFNIAQSWHMSDFFLKNEKNVRISSFQIIDDETFKYWCRKYKRIILG